MCVQRVVLCVYKRNGSFRPAKQEKEWREVIVLCFSFASLLPDERTSEKVRKNSREKKDIGSSGGSGVEEDI